jgi:hypothetical protein
VLRSVGAVAARVEHQRRVLPIAIHDARFPDAPDFFAQQVLPQSQCTQGSHAGMGQRDVPPVLGRGGQGIAQLCVQHGSGEAGVDQGEGQRQPGRTGTDDEDVTILLHTVSSVDEEPDCERRRRVAVLTGSRVGETHVSA